MDFRLANSVLEGAKDDLESGRLSSAIERLSEAVRIDPNNFYGNGPIPNASRTGAAKMARGVRKNADKGPYKAWNLGQKADMYRQAGARKKGNEAAKKSSQEYDKPKSEMKLSVAGGGGGQGMEPERKRKTYPGPTLQNISDRPTIKMKAVTPKKESVMKLRFASVVKKPKTEASDTPEELGAFLHRNFGHKGWDHKKAMRVAMKAHEKPKDFARAAADHYMTLGKGNTTKAEQVETLESILAELREEEDSFETARLNGASKMRVSSKKAFRASRNADDHEGHQYAASQHRVAAGSHSDPEMAQRHQRSADAHVRAAKYLAKVETTKVEAVKTKSRWLTRRY